MRGVGGEEEGHGKGRCVRERADRIGQGMELSIGCACLRGGVGRHDGERESSGKGWDV